MATTRLLTLGWPEGSGLTGSSALASLIGEHAMPARAALSPPAGSAGGPRRARRDVNIWGPPVPSAQCGALILAADAVISPGDPSALRDAVQELAGAAALLHPRGLWAVRNMDRLSPGYQRAIAPRRDGFRTTPVDHRLLPPARECLFTVEEIPSFLPRKWYDDHLAALAAEISGPAARTSRHLRRLAVLKLAEMSAGGTWRTSARQLGIPEGAAKSTLEILRRRFTATGNWEEFDRIVEQIARALDQDGHRVNYAARRRALESWQIPLDHWATICAGTHAGPGPRQGPLDPGIGTILAWESATQSEHLHSPLLARTQHRGTGSLIDKIAVFRTPAARKGSHLIILNRIEEYAALLARHCDDGTGTEISLGHLLPWSPECSPRHHRAPGTPIASDRAGRRARDTLPARLSSVPHPIGVPAIADHEPPAWQSGRYQPDAGAWEKLRPQLRPGQQLTGTVAWMTRPGVTGIGVDLGLPVGGFVDVVHMPRDPGRWPALGTVATFIIWHIDERPQIRLVPADPRYRREDFDDWARQQATPAAAAFRELQPPGPAMTEASIEHPWLGTVRRHGDSQLIAFISIPPAIRPARANGDASAEVLIAGASPTADLPALADDAASRVQAALAALDAIKDYAAEHAPSLLPAPASLRNALFLEGFTISATGTEIAFDYGDLDMIVVQADPSGQCHSVVLCP